jgi:hypothetical protein
MPLRPASSLVLAILVVSRALRAQEPAGNALGLADAFLAAQAQNSAEYRADVRATMDDAPIPPGRIAGHSSLLGAFTYRPRTYLELSARARAEILSDPKFRIFLVSVRQSVDGPGFRTGLPGKPMPSPDLGTIDLVPEEVLRPSPVWILVPR